MTARLILICHASTDAVHNLFPAPTSLSTTSAGRAQRHLPDICLAPIAAGPVRSYGRGKPRKCCNSARTCNRPCTTANMDFGRDAASMVRARSKRRRDVLARPGGNTAR